MSYCCSSCGTHFVQPAENVRKAITTSLANPREISAEGIIATHTPVFSSLERMGTRQKRPSHFWIFHNVWLPRTRSSCPSFCSTSTSWTGRTTGSLSLMRRRQLCVFESREGLGPKVCDRFQVAFYRLSGHVTGFFSGVTLGYNLRKFYYTNCKPTLWLRSEYDFKFFGACPWRSLEWANSPNFINS